ncbi:DUF3540 domain-containing protein [Candidatus Curculioniphilus buchneri]|uniref:DUF3540 domain-containing protein n=1 Tax=Candidatus Curculioniphilus buchneri TaxID=690594 RepID=UPI00376EAA1C
MCQSNVSITEEYLSQTVGYVANVLQGGLFIVKLDREGFLCRQATSCLITPKIGDQVLIIKNGTQFWLLAILERTKDPSFTLSVPGTLMIAPYGNLRLVTSDILALQSYKLVIDANEGKCHIQNMTYHGASLSAWISLCTFTGKCLDTVWKTVVSISQRLLRKVTYTEHIRVGQWDCQANDYARLHSRHLLMTAEAIAKIDADQIHIG